MDENKINKQLQDLYETKKEEFSKGFDTAVFEGIEAYSLDKETGNVLYSLSPCLLVYLIQVKFVLFYLRLYI